MPFLARDAVTACKGMHIQPGGSLITNFELFPHGTNVPCASACAASQRCRRSAHAIAGSTRASTPPTLPSASS